MCVQSEETFRGHLVLTFIATIVMKLLQDKLADSKDGPMAMLDIIANLKCSIYDEVIITGEPSGKADDTYKKFKIQCPTEISRSS